MNRYVDEIGKPDDGILTFIGDTHEPEEWGRLRESSSLSIHVGDLAYEHGRGNLPHEDYRHWFIRGNHDIADWCENRNDYLGNYGFVESLNLFYVSGAQSTEPFYMDEELNDKQMREVEYLLLGFKPNIIVSHDCPFEVLGDKNFQGSTRTNRFLSRVFGKMVAHRCQPALWVFGHHHMEVNRTLLGTRFAGLAKYQSKKLNLNATSMKLV